MRYYTENEDQGLPGVLLNDTKQGINMFSTINNTQYFPFYRSVKFGL
jgi:hypothetical protein